jgi:hypothetical protein
MQCLGPWVSDKGCQNFPSNHVAIWFILLLIVIKYARDNCVGLVDIGQTDWNGTKNGWAEIRTALRPIFMSIIRGNNIHNLIIENCLNLWPI